MKNIVLSVMVVCTLIGGALAGTLADFSDIEVSRDNYFETGSLDLKVSDYMGRLYQDPDVPAFYQVSDAWPCCDKSVFFDLENFGQGFQAVPHVYMHIKNLNCYWIVPKNPIWVDEDGDVVAAPVPAPPTGTIGTGFPKPLCEPEYVAECGGIAGENATGQPVEVPGIGLCYGETCELAEHVGVLIEVAGPYDETVKPATSYDVPTDDWEALDLSDYDLNGDGVIKLNELVCVQIDLGGLPNNAGLWVHVSLHLQDFTEEDAYAQGLIPTTYFDETIPAELKWNDWPTNALMKDGMSFDMAFELLQLPAP
jgi:predicted ribosomally synthesized peptide with SipW-like signal peptide